MAVQQLAPLTLSDDERAELMSLTMRRKTAQALAQGRSDEARALLEPICRSFDEEDVTADLKRARDVQSALH